MRGKGIQQGNARVRMGITPAYAGKRCVRPISASQSGDHPRVCGEKPPQRGRPSRASGSPPRMRGKVIDDLPESILDGITPAYAGKRKEYKLAVKIAGDHPRVCGEK